MSDSRDTKYSLLSHEDPSDSCDSDMESAVGFRDKKPSPRQLMAELRGKRHTSSTSYVRPMGCLCKCGVCLSVLLGLTLVGMIAASLTSLYLSQNHMNFKDILPKFIHVDDSTTPLDDTHTSSNTANKNLTHWKVEMKDAGTESPIRAVDINNDGVLDILFGVSLVHPYNGTEYCLSLATEPVKQYCNGAVYALSGKTGEQLWTIYTHDEVFDLQCPEGYDVNKDKQDDCIGSGRHGTLVSFNPINGSVFWREEHPGITNRFNVFSSCMIGDMTKDGIADLIVVNGGDTNYPPEEHDRDPGFLVMIDGSTGKSVGYKFQTPDSKESYSLPVLYKTSNSISEQFIIFGTGGETVGGGLYMISLFDFLSNIVTEEEYTRNVSTNDRWPSKQRDVHGVITLESDKDHSKGFILPVIIADTNNDGMPDILAVSFDGFMYAYDGATLDHLWEPIIFDNNASVELGTNGTQESYSLPGLGDINGDGYLDIITSWWSGIWPTYNSISTYVISGNDGKQLWYQNSPAPVLAGASHLALNLDGTRDALIFQLSSTNQPYKEHGTHDIGFNKRHIGHGAAVISCDNADDLFIDEFIFDPYRPTEPIQIQRLVGEKYYYNLTDGMILRGEAKSQLLGAGRLNKRHEEEHDDKFPTGNRTRCTPFRPREATTGMLADMDKDGLMDYVGLHTKFALLKDDKGTTLDTLLEINVQIMPLEAMLPELKRIKLEGVTTSLISDDTNDSIKISKRQTWNQLYGPNQDNTLLL